jgi:hypothetical protein
MGRGDAGGGSAPNASSAAADPAVVRHLSVAIDRVGGGSGDATIGMSSPPASSKRAGMLEATKSINALLEGGGRTVDDLVDDTEWPSTVLQDKDKCTAIIHLYRAEVGRLAAYRTRLDNTTNWCSSHSGRAISLLCRSRVYLVSIHFSPFTFHPSRAGVFPWSEFSRHFRYRNQWCLTTFSASL